MLQCPTDSVIGKVLFASYGDPSGECDNLQYGTCHLASTALVVEKQCLGKDRCALRSDALFFRNPCPDAAIKKELKVQVSCIRLCQF